MGTAVFRTSGCPEVSRPLEGPPVTDAYAGGMRLLVYTLFRLALVLAAAGLLYLLGLRSWVLWVAAVVVGALVSFLVLGRQREEAAKVLAQYDPLREERPTFSPQVEADAAYEDAIVDAAGHRQPEGSTSPGGSAVGEDARRPGDPAERAGDPGERAGDAAEPDRDTTERPVDEPPAREAGDDGTRPTSA